jgi:hypothetical protein
VHNYFSLETLREETLVRSNRKLDDNIKIGLNEIGCGLDSSVSGSGPVSRSSEQYIRPSDNTKIYKFLSSRATVSY